MKRTLIVAAIAAGASFCVGAAVGPKLTFPWASKALNETVTMTVLEKTLLEKGHFRAVEPIVLKEGVGRKAITVSAIDSITPVIIKGGIRLDATVRLHGEPASRLKPRAYNIIRLIPKQWVKQTGLSGIPLWVRASVGKKAVGIMEDDGNIETVYD